MRLHFICVPVFDDGKAQAELNRFLATHRVVAVDRQLLAFRAVCASYADQP